MSYICEMQVLQIESGLASRVVFVIITVEVRKPESIQANALFRVTLTCIVRIWADAITSASRASSAYAISYIMPYTMYVVVRKPMENSYNVKIYYCYVATAARLLPLLSCPCPASTINTISTLPQLVYKRQLATNGWTDCHWFWEAITVNRSKTLYIGWSDITYLWSQCDRHFVGQHVVLHR